MTDKKEHKGYGGRPTRYKKCYCKDAISFLEDGKNITQLAAYFGVSKDTIQEWRKVYPEFSDSISRGMELSAAYWVDIADRYSRGLYAPNDPKPNYQLLALTLKNKGGYVEKQEVKVSGEAAQLTYEEMKAQKEALMKKLSGFVSENET